MLKPLANKEKPLPHHDLDKPKETWEAELKFRSWLLDRVTVLGSSTWASMPITFFLAWFGYSAYLYVFVVIKVFIISMWQTYLSRETKRWFQAHEPDTPWLEALEKADTWDLPSCSVVEAAFYFLGSLSWLSSKLLDFAEAVDPDLDTMTPGNARTALTDAQAWEFQKSWADVPILGTVCGYLGLPGVLATGMVVIALYQIKQFRHVWTLLRSDLFEERAVGFYPNLFHLADSGGLLIFASRARLVAVHRPKFKFGWPWTGDRGFSFTIRVPEMVFQCWFTVSVAVFTFGTGEVWKQIPVFVSIATSYCCAMKSLYEGFYELGAWHGVAGFGFWFRVLFISYLLITARIVGIWICDDSHDLQLSRMRCRH